MGTNSRLTASEIKQAGAHYTPPDLARFLAKSICAQIRVVDGHPLRVLDPACGDGGLLEALAIELPEETRRLCTLVGMENDPDALSDAEERLKHLSGCSGFELIDADFLDWTSNFRQSSLFGRGNYPEKFDVVISNPPYVRTQVMGADKARELAAEYGLTGRIDLYHAFALAMADVLKEDGVLGLLCSNRFLSIQSGSKLRHMLLNTFRLHDVFDLGDTKLFSAAVLPAIVIGTKQQPSGADNCSFTKVYELHSPVGENHVGFDNIIAAIEAKATGPVRVPGGLFEIESANLAIPGSSSEPWRLSSPTQEGWLGAVWKNAPLTFADVAKVHVGIKTTADNVFIRSDWDVLSADMRPEPELLRPLLSNDIAAPWWPTRPASDLRVLYTHTVVNGKRVPIDLCKYPKAARYLENHRQQLEGRSYVIEAGRKWYEIWVPQNPADWAKPKVVFADISSTPKFYLDRTRAIVDGNCYWFTGKEKTLYLLLAVANSSFILRFYDSVCGNKLYAGRRRFITQYVQRFPVPDPEAKVSRKIVDEVRSLLNLDSDSPDASRSMQQIDDLVWQSFGLVKEVRR
ncbi:MAG: N-6 DNA methylase [Candidatus Korobacteraceae bacterium]|jgi:adenine-specific DNA-methyltransferase